MTAHTSFQIDLPPNATIQSATVHDMLGRNVYPLTLSGNKLNVENLDGGNYLLELQLVDGQCLYAKMLKE